jgi:hypothetical protein
VSHNQREKKHYQLATFGIHRLFKFAWVIANTGKNSEILRVLFLAGISFPKNHSGIFFWPLLVRVVNTKVHYLDMQRLVFLVSCRALSA